MKDPDDAVVRSAVTDNLHVHPRLLQQGMEPSARQRKALLKSLPNLMAFTGNTYHAARAILDWDHQLPSQHQILRLFMCYGDREARILDGEITRRDREIASDNLYPEFDLPDYGMLPASETYVAVMRADQPVIEDLRFSSEWRRRVDQSAQRAALTSVRRCRPGSSWSRPPIPARAGSARSGPADAARPRSSATSGVCRVRCSTDSTSGSGSTRRRHQMCSGSDRPARAPPWCATGSLVLVNGPGGAASRPTVSSGVRRSREPPRCRQRRSRSCATTWPPAG